MSHYAVSVLDYHPVALVNNPHIEYMIPAMPLYLLRSPELHARRRLHTYDESMEDSIHTDRSRRSSSHTDYHPHASPSPQLQTATSHHHHHPKPSTPTASSSRVSTPRTQPRSPLPIPTNDSVNQYFANAIRAKSQQPLSSYPISPQPQHGHSSSSHPQSPMSPTGYSGVESHYAPLYANKINFSGYPTNLASPATKAASRSSSLLCHSANVTDSPLMQAKRRDHHKLAYRYSDASTWDIKASKNKKNRRNYHSMSETIETLADPVVEDADLAGDRTSWEYHTVSVTRVSGYGFGIAVSGGRDNPHFANGDPSIAVSDVLKGGPAEERLQVNDRIISVNGVSLENVEYSTAVQVLRDSGNTVTLMVKRRVPHMGMNMMATNMPAVGVGGGHHHQLSNISLGAGGIGSAIGAFGSGPIVGPGSVALQQQQQQQQQQQYLKLVLSKTSKKEDFGIVLGCRLFVKEISAKARDQLALNGYTLQEGDIVTRLHNTNTNDTMSLKEARKIMDGCKERLNLAVLRDITASATNAGHGAHSALPLPPPQSPVYSHTAQPSNCSNIADDASFFAGNGGGAGNSAANNSYSAQNLYVQPPTRPSGGLMHEDKSNLTPRGRSRNPLMDVSLLQLDRPASPRDLPPAPPVDLDLDPPRPPPPREEDFYASRRQLYEEDPLRRAKQSAEPRFISFQKEGSVGIRLTGGNEAGIFVTAVQPGSPASLQGLTPGDKILKVNDMDMAGVTREEAVLFLLSLQDRIDLIVQHCREEYDHAVANQRGDSFHIKTHFHCETPTKGEMSFKAGDIFRVVDTLHNGVVGAWQVLRIGRGQQEIQRGVIPNKARAEELATAQFNANKKEANSAESRTSFFRRRRPTHRRSKSLSRENWDDVVFSDSSISKFPAYERVVLRHPGFVRPVVMFGPVADLARERLIKDFPDKFTAPAQGVHHSDDADDGDKSGAKCGIVRLSNIRDIMDRGKHALLDITPNAVDRLNYAQFYPIVVFLKADNKHQIKQLRQGIPKSVHKSSKKLLDQCQKMDRVWSHVFSGVLMLNDADTWYRKLRDTIDQLQSGAIWMSENKPVESLSDDFLFPMNTTSRLSYASSPESDLEMSPGPSTSLSLGNLPQLVKSSSDPSIATNQDLLERDRELGKMDEAALPPPYTTTNGRPAAIVTESKYGFTSDDKPAADSGKMPPVTGAGQLHNHQHQHSHPQQAGFYGKVPELPPRIDRASKPPGGYPNSPPQAGARPPMSPDLTTSAAAGTFRRNTAQDRLFGSRNVLGDGSGPDPADGGDYGAQRPLPDDPTHNSLDRSGTAAAALMSPKRIGGSGQHHQQQHPPPLPANNGSYDSVSSYDSGNTTQQQHMSQMQQQQRLIGPNAPDDLKSVPPASLNSLMGGGSAPNGGASSQDPHHHNLHQHLHQHHHLSKRPSMHEHTRSAVSNGRQSSPGRPPFVGGAATTGGIPPAQHPGLSMLQRPTHLGLDMSPPTKKPQPGHSSAAAALETKTDYGKYSRNNSATQADYAMRAPGSPQIGGQPGPSGNGGVPFKPVPPPKPKNYHPPMQRNQMGGNGYWENGAPMEPSSPRSPNGFYYPPAPSHYHHHQNPGAGGAHMPPPPPQHQPQQQQQQSKHPNSYGQYGHQPPHFNGQQQQQQSPSYGYHGGAPTDYQAHHHRAPGMGKSVPPLPPGNHPSERSALDLAGSREQRGSAFELYRKPQIGNVGHHHNMSDMESTSSVNSGVPPGQQFRFANDGSMGGNGGYPPEDPYYAPHQQQQQHHQPPYHQYQHDDGGEPMYMPQRPMQRHPQHAQYADQYVEHQHHQQPPPLPPPLKPKKKTSMLKSPFTALKKAFNKTTRPLRRQNSMIDPSTAAAAAQKPQRLATANAPGLRRQHSMLEASRPRHFAGTPDMSGQRRRHYYSEDAEPVYMQRHEAFRPAGASDTYQNLEPEAIYGNCVRGGGAPSQAGYYDSGEASGGNAALYANNSTSGGAFQRNGPATSSYGGGGRDQQRQDHDDGDPRHPSRRIVRRHSMADRPGETSGMQRGRSEPPRMMASGAGRYDVPPPQSRSCRYDVPPPPEPVANHDGGGGDETIYQTRSGAYMMDTVVAARRHQQQQQQQQDEAIYQSRREMHRDHLYQSRAEMQQRIQQGRVEAEHRSTVTNTTTATAATPTDIDAQHHSPHVGCASASSSTASTGSQSPGGRSSATGTNKDAVVYQSRRELKERGFRTRTELRDHIYQSRREAMQSMAEPVYVSRREMRPEPIYEARESQCFEAPQTEDRSGDEEADPTAVEDGGGEESCRNDLSLKDVIDHLDNGFIDAGVAVADQSVAGNATLATEDTDDDDEEDDDDDDDDDDEDATLTPQNQQSNQSDLEKTAVAAAAQHNQAETTMRPPSAPQTPRAMRDPYHISNMIKRTAPQPSPTRDIFADANGRRDAAAAVVADFGQHPHASRTSIETHFTAAGASMMSLPTGPPNAQSTPYASQMALPAASAAAGGAEMYPPLREQTTMRGVFDAAGGQLCDAVWNVSISIPPGAIAAGVQQEIYFTVTDPRLSQVVGGPPLDMENGETMLSPLVMCGPQGIEFLRPVTLNIPHCAGRTASLGLALKATDSEKNLHTNWDNIDLPSNAPAHTVSVQVDHF